MLGVRCRLNGTRRVPRSALPCLHLGHECTIKDSKDSAVRDISLPLADNQQIELLELKPGPPYTALSSQYTPTLRPPDHAASHCTRPAASVRSPMFESHPPLGHQPGWQPHRERTFALGRHTGPTKPNTVHTVHPVSLSTSHVLAHTGCTSESLKRNFSQQYSTSMIDGGKPRQGLNIRHGLNVSRNTSKERVEKTFRLSRLIVTRSFTPAKNSYLTS